MTNATVTSNFSKSVAADNIKYAVVMICWSTKYLPTRWIVKGIAAYNPIDIAMPLLIHLEYQIVYPLAAEFPPIQFSYPQS
jgi:hypothetical protein